MPTDAQAVVLLYLHVELPCPRARLPRKRLVDGWPMLRRGWIERVQGARGAIVTDAGRTALARWLLRGLR